MLKQLLGAVLTLTVGLGYAVTPANAGTTGVSPNGDVINSTSDGFPAWYKAQAPNIFGNTGSQVEVRLKPCFPGPTPANPNCGVPTQPNPTQGITFPGNFPSEFFYWRATARIQTGGIRADLVLATEGAFTNGNVAIDTQQMVFSRIRIKVSGLVKNAFYTITHPYGVGVSTGPMLQADSTGTINVTDNYGCGAVILPACDFDGPDVTGTGTGTGIPGPIGPWLVWDPTDTANGGAPPPGFIGDAATAHKVIGSPTGNNLFQILGPGLGSSGSIQTNLFTVTGECFQKDQTGQCVP